jgi:hypothetical protein
MSACGRTFVKTTERSAYGESKDACKYCGMTEEAHEPPPVIIHFQGQRFVFKDWDDAKSAGFYSDVDKIEDFGNERNVILNDKRLVKKITNY